MIFKRVKNFLLDFIFPRLCAGCGLSGVLVCAECLGRMVAENKRMTFRGSNFDELLVAIKYEKNSLIQKLIFLFKYHYSRDLAEILGQFLVSLFEQYNHFPRDRIIVTFVPMHKKREKFRGFNHAESLAKCFGAKADLPVAEILKRIRNTQEQAQLKRSERLVNLKDSFQFLGPGLEGKIVVLVDDVSTTGTTLTECSKVLKENGAGHVIGLVLCHG